MLYRIIILLLFPLILQAQSNVYIPVWTGTLTDTTYVKTTTNQTIYGEKTFTNTVDIDAKDMNFHPTHTNMSFKDSAVVLSGGTNVQITNATDSLYRVFEADDVNYIFGDTLEVTIKGAYNVFCNVRGFGNNGADWQVNIAKKSAGVTTYANSVLEYTTTGANNKNGGFKMWYMHYEIGDKIWLVISRTAGTGDFTCTTSSWYFEELYSRE